MLTMAAEPFIAEIRAFPFDSVPRGWAACDGQLLSVKESAELFSIIGTRYGGDGLHTFALPDLRGRLAMHAGDGPGLSRRTVGEEVGTASVRLLPSELATHTHALSSSIRPSDANDPTDCAPGTGNALFANATAGQTSTMSAATLGSAGTGGPHNNMQPSLALNLCIALIGEFPPRG